MGNRCGNCCPSNKQIYLDASAIFFSDTNTFFLPIGRKDGQGVFHPMPVHFPPIKRLDVAFDVEDAGTNALAIARHFKDLKKFGFHPEDGYEYQEDSTYWRNLVKAYHEIPP